MYAFQLYWVKGSINTRALQNLSRRLAQNKHLKKSSWPRWVFAAVVISKPGRRCVTESGKCEGAPGRPKWGPPEKGADGPTGRGKVVWCRAVTGLRLGARLGKWGVLGRTALRLARRHITSSNYKMSEEKRGGKKKKSSYFCCQTWKQNQLRKVLWWVQYMLLGVGAGFYLIIQAGGGGTIPQVEAQTGAVQKSQPNIHSILQKLKFCSPF